MNGTVKKSREYRVCSKDNKTTVAKQITMITVPVLYSVKLFCS